MNLGRPTQGHYATSSSCTRKIIAHQCGKCQVAFKLKSNLEAHKREHYNKKEESNLEAPTRKTIRSINEQSQDMLL